MSRLCQGGELGQHAFSEVNMGEKKLGDIKTRNLYSDTRFDGVLLITTIHKDF